MTFRDWLKYAVKNRKSNGFMQLFPELKWQNQVIVQ